MMSYIARAQVYIERGRSEANGYPIIDYAPRWVDGISMTSFSS